MRSTLLAVLVAALIPACIVGTGDVTGQGSGSNPAGGGGGGGGGTGGGGGGGTGGGGGGGGMMPTPTFTVSIDQTSLSTELSTSNQFMLTLTSMNGFAGTVNLTPTVVDANNAAITGWTVTTAMPSVDLAADASMQVAATLDIPSQNMGLTGTLQIDAADPTGAVATQSVTSAITVANQVSFVVKENGNGQCVYPTGLSNANPVKVTVGSKVRFVNMSPGTIEIHSNGAGEGICHENQPCNGDPATPGTLNTNDVYVQTAKSAGGAFSWYCHAPGPDLGGQDPYIQVVN